MKRKMKFLGLIAIAVIIGFSMTGCGEKGGGDGDGNNNQPLFSVSGEFKGAGSGNALFQAATTETVSRSARAVTVSYELTGELEDGDMLLRLRGTYDPSTDSYTVSSASSFARYTINGDARGATATLAVKSGEEWISFIVSVTIKEVSIKDGDAQEYAGGIPSWAQGRWYDWWSQNKNNYNENSFETGSYFDQWYYEAWRSSVYHDNWNYTSTKYTVIQAEQLDNDVYDVIFSYPFYKATDAQIKAAFEEFFKKINHPAEFWDKPFAPWDREAWIGGEDDDGKNYDNSVIWYICMNENHPYYLEPKMVNWETWHTFFDTEEKRDEFWAANPWDEPDWQKRKEAVEAFLASKNIPSWYYWGWHEADWNPSDNHEDRAYTCWEPSCEDGGDGGWWDKTHYYATWGNQTGIQGDWDKHRGLFQKWTDDDYLITYLRSQNVEPETWYTRVRMSMGGDTFYFQYYNGDYEAQDSHPVPPCDTKSKSKIESLTFDPDFWGWGYLWQRQKRAAPRD